jgi:hypothetical protein
MIREWHATPMHQILAPQQPLLSDSPPLKNPALGALYLGSISAIIDTHYLSSHGITHIVHVIDGPFEPFDKGHFFICYQIDIDDHQSVDLAPHLNGVCNYIDMALQSGGNVLVHCHMVCIDYYPSFNCYFVFTKARILQGVSRSASIVIAYLIRSKNMTYDAAHSFVLSKRGIIRPNAGFVKCLQEWEIENRPEVLSSLS